MIQLFSEQPLYLVLDLLHLCDSENLGSVEVCERNLFGDENKRRWENDIVQHALPFGSYAHIAVFELLNEHHFKFCFEKISNGTVFPKIEREIDSGDCSG